MILQSKMQNETALTAPVQTVFRYLAEIRTLVSQVPMAEKILIAPDGQSGQVFFKMCGLGKTLKVTLGIDLDPDTDQTTGLIKVKPSETLLAQPDHDTLIGHFRAVLKVAPHHHEDSTQILTQIHTSVDLSPLNWTHFIPKRVINGPVLCLFQQYMETIFGEHSRRLITYFPQWLEHQPE
jgi:hypothetical protein